MWHSIPQLVCGRLRKGTAYDWAARRLWLRRTAKKVIMDKATIKKDSIASTLLTNQTLNLFGIGSALIGLQVCCGILTSWGLYPHRRGLFSI